MADNHLMHMLDRLIGGVEAANRVLLGGCRYGVITLVAVLAVILSAAVFYRYALNNAISWSEEGSKYLMVWLTFLGAPIALRHGAAVSVDFAPKALKGRPQQLLYLLINLIVVFVISVIFYKGFQFAQLGARQVASTFNMSMVYLYASIPVGSFLILMVAIEHALKALRGVMDPERGFSFDDSALADEVRE